MKRLIHTTRSTTCNKYMKLHGNKLVQGTGKLDMQSLQEWDSISIDNWENINDAHEEGIKGRYHEKLIDLSEKGSIYAKILLAELVDKGKVEGVDRNEARRLYSDAAQSGNHYSMFFFARFLLKNGSNEEAFNIIDKAAHEGDLPSIYMLAKMHLKGIGCVKSYEDYRHYIEFAASKGHLWAKRQVFVDMIKCHYGKRYIIVGLYRFIVLLGEIFLTSYRDPDSDLIRA